LARLFEAPGVCAVKLDSVSIDIFETFLTWLDYHCRWKPPDFTFIDKQKHSYGRMNWDRITHARSCFSRAYFDDPMGFECAGYYGDVGETAIELFIFAETYDIPKLRHDAIDRLVHCFSQDEDPRFDPPYQVYPSIVTRAYEMTSDGSPIRKILVAGCCAVDSLQDDGMMDMPKQFLADLVKEARAKGMARKSRDGEPGVPIWELDPCD
jgi:hypothetical protein